MSIKPNPESQTPEEKFAAISKLTLNIEDNFLTLGNLLSDVKQTKLYRFKGYEKFADYVSAEYHFNAGLANKLIAIFDLFAEEMDISDPELVEIGFDRLCMIKPFMDKADWLTREEWMKMASELPPKDLKEHIKTVKAEAKKNDIDFKDVFIDQFKERLVSIFNCSAKELMFKLALYFNGFDNNQLTELKAMVKQAQRQFESVTVEQHADAAEVQSTLKMEES